tara:strand:+ start:142 stop:474 length:333 start_codon:yes stop_codon:yes gene_type:complete
VKFDHVALSVKKNEVESTALWYREKMSAEILYLDETWAMLSVCGVKIALVVPEQHPPHIAFTINEIQYIDLKKAGKIFKIHRDKSESFYEKDPSGNMLEFVFWKTYGQED